jgi:sporulation protein YlmC with PRC-barrel domain
MKLALRPLLIAFGATLALTVNAQSVQQADIRPGMQKATDWLGRAVTTHDGQDLGRVQDFAIDQNTGKIAFVVVSVGSFLIEHNLIAVDTDALRPIPGVKGVLVLQADDDALRQATRFANDQWPAQAEILRSRAITTTPAESAERYQSASATKTPAPESGTASITNGLRTAFLSPGERTIQNRLEPLTPAPSPIRKKAPKSSSARPATEFDRLDSDGDDALNRAEIALQISRKDSYSDLDRNANGFIDRDEYDAFQVRREAQD